MHEAGIVEELLRAAHQAARAEGCSRIHRIVIRVGVFSSAVPEALAFAFEALRPGTSAAGAVLDIEREAAASYCEACHKEFEVDDPVFLCPDCGRVCAELRRGFALDLVRIEAD